MKILVSGCSGFVGRNLIKSLKDNYNIHALTRERKSNDDSIEAFVTWNNLSQKDMHDIDAVIHLAGKAHDLKKASNPEEYFYVNTELTKKLFDLFLLSPARDFIYFSSVKAVADKVEGTLSEVVIPDPQTPYGQSKLKAEEYLLSRSLPNGKRLFILRPCMIHGPGNKGNLNLLFQFVKRGIPYPLAAFKNKRSFLSIDNLIYIVNNILENSGIESGVYNMADDEPLPTTEVINIIGKASNIKPKQWALSPKMLQYAAAFGDKFRLPLNSERLKKLTESYVVDNHKIKKALNIKAFPVASRDGLVATIRSFKR